MIARHFVGLNDLSCRRNLLSRSFVLSTVAQAKALRPRVRVTIFGSTIEYPYPEQDACKSLTNGQCPLSEGDGATYNLKMPISKMYPSLSMTIEFSLIDENGNVHVCFELEGKVTDK